MLGEHGDDGENATLVEELILHRLHEGIIKSTQNTMKKNKHKMMEGMKRRKCLGQVLKLEKDVTAGFGVHLLQRLVELLLKVYTNNITNCHIINKN